MTKDTKSYIPVENTLAQIQVLEEYEKMDNNVPCLKHGTPIGLKDVTPHKRKGRNKGSTLLNLKHTTSKEETTQKRLKPIKDHRSREY